MLRQKSAPRGNRDEPLHRLCYRPYGGSGSDCYPARDNLDVRPGGHAKWVESPHGPATVSGERTLRCPSNHVLIPVRGASLGSQAWEDVERPALIRKSGNLVDPGASFFGA